MTNPLKKYLAFAESRSTLLYFFSSVFNALIGVVTLPIFTKYLTPSEFGIWGLVIAINNFLLPLIQLGLNSYFIKEYYTKDGFDNKLLFSSLFYFTLLWSLLVIGVGAAIGPIVFRATSIQFGFFPYMFLVLSSNISIACFTYLPLQYRVDRKALSYSLILIARTLLITTISIVLVVLYEQSIMGRINGFLIGNIIFFIFCLPFLKKYLILRLDIRVIKRGLHKCLPLVPAVLITILFDTVDRLFLERSTSLQVVGFYNIAAQYSGMLNMAAVSFYKAIEPNIFKWISERQSQKLSMLFFVILCVLCAMAFAALFMAKPVIQVLADPSYYDAIPIAQTLVLTVFVQGVYMLSSTYGVAQYCTRTVMLASILGLSLFLPAMYYLVAIFGANGVAYAKAAAFLAMSVVVFIGVNERYILRKFLLFAVLMIAIILYSVTKLL